VSRPGRLDGQTALIVGGTGGIGLAAAQRFLAEGARVVVSGRTPEEVEAARTTLDGLGPSLALVLDLTAPASVAVAFQDALDWLGARLDILLHVAGISGRRFGDGPLHECGDDGWDQVLAVNARGVFLTNREAVRQMRAQPDRGLEGPGRGSIVNVGSVLTVSPSPRLFGTVAYAASKGAVRALTLASAARYAPERIRFNLIEPGLIDTPMARRAVGDPAIRAYLAHKQPLSAGPGLPEDVAQAALYLCEPSSRFVTGTVLTVDGGWCLSQGCLLPDSPP
jgi:NAD(P)-dependent dehydrogenase (short-subunit alcohol dehydrogenase family)